MAQFDVYRSVGPNIDTSLFLNAMKTGVEVGNALGTPLSNAIQGGLKGYEQGQQFQTTDLENQIKQHQIDQFPAQDQLEQLKIKNAQLDYENRLTNNDIAAQDETAKLQNDKLKNEDELALRKQTNDFYTQMQNADPDQQFNMITGPANFRIFANDNDLFKQSLQRLKLNLPEEDPRQDVIDGLLEKSNAKSASDKAALANLRAYSGFNQEWQSSASFNALHKALPDIPQDQLADNIQYTPHNQFQHDVDGNILMDPKTNFQTPLETEGFDMKGAIGYDVLNKEGTKILVPNVEKGDKAIHDKLQTSKGKVSGRDLNNQYNQINSQTSDKMRKRNQSELESFGFNPQPKAESPETEHQKTAILFGKTFNLDADNYPLIDPHVKQIISSIDTYIKNPAMRVTSQNQINNEKGIIARVIADEQYRRSPAIQLKYNEKTVKDYNSALSGTGLADDLMAPYRVDNPPDLYFQSQKDEIMDALDGLEKTLKARKQAQADYPVNNLRAKKALEQTLSGALKG